MFNINDTVKLLVDLKEGQDFASLSHEDIKAGSVGTVCEIINDTNVLVEFENSSIFVVSVAISKLSKF